MTSGPGAGTLADRARTTDIVDANVVEGALRGGDLFISSDEGDLATIAAAVSRHIDTDHPLHPTLAAATQHYQRRSVPNGWRAVG